MNCIFCDGGIEDFLNVGICQSCSSIFLPDGYVKIAFRDYGISIFHSIANLGIDMSKFYLHGIEKPNRFPYQITDNGFNCAFIRESNINILREKILFLLSNCDNDLPFSGVIQLPVFLRFSGSNDLVGRIGFDWIISKNGVDHLFSDSGFDYKTGVNLIILKKAH